MKRMTVCYHSPFRHREYLEAMSNLELKGLNPIDIVGSIVSGIHQGDLYFTRNLYIMKSIHPGLSYAYLHQQYLIIEKFICNIVKPMVVPDGLIISQLDEDGLMIDYVYSSA